MPAVTVRGLRSEDIPACHAIYNANKAGRFPVGYFEYFAADLENDKYLWLVVEDQSEIAAVGGICLHESAAIGHFGTLTFGMVRPDRHRQGLGSVLLLARLAALPVPEEKIYVGMTATPATVDFYKRYGFKFAGRAPGDRGVEFDTYYTVVSRAAQEACRTLLKAGGIDYDANEHAVPVGPPESGRNRAPTTGDSI